jgi:hypothetical protein
MLVEIGNAGHHPSPRNGAARERHGGCLIRGRMALGGHRASHLLALSCALQLVATAPVTARTMTRAEMARHLERNGARLDPSRLRRIAGRWQKTAGEPVGRFADRRYASAELPALLIGLHREQLASARYLEERGPNPTTGTLDPVHAEDTASIAVDMARAQGIAGDALVLLRVAAHLHDADRSFPRTMVPGEDRVRKNPILYARYKDAHQRSSVARTHDLLADARGRGARASARFVRDLTFLVGRHELGGRDGRRTRLDRLADILRDADSTAFFTTNIASYLAESGGDPKKLAQKIDYMFARMSPASRAWVIEHVVSAPKGMAHLDPMSARVLGDYVTAGARAGRW